MLKDMMFVIVLMLANVIQAITGFAGGPLAMPICIALVGLSDAKAAITLIFLGSSGVVALMNLKHIQFKKLGIMLAFMVLGMIPGLWLYDRVSTKSLMILYGAIVVLIGIWKLSGKGSGEMKKGWAYVFVILAGAMQGMFTSGGPFLALYATTALKDKKEFRSTVSSIWFVLNIYLCTNMYRQGMYTPHACKLTLYSIIPVGIGIWLGNMIAKKIDQKTFLKLVYVLLMASGAILLWNAI